MSVEFTCQSCFTEYRFPWWNIEYQDECPACTADYPQNPNLSLEDF